MKRSAKDLARLSQLLDAALDLPIQDRATWVDQLAAADDEFKAALRGMLLETPTAGAADTMGVRRYLNEAANAAASMPAVTELEEGVQIGPYELIRELGRGGMGTVWLSRRVEGLTRRLVALKLPHSGLQRAELAQRIARERDILESLTHPHIARLYDAGITPAGQAYLALEYVEGTPINIYCEAKGLNTRARVILIQQVLNAMQYAHTQLVIHRDLKPANILVTESGQAMLLDFGIAKLLTNDRAEETALTRFGSRALTPDYASPEQIAGETLGTASDVYSMGIVIYELLTGQRPYKFAKSSLIAHTLSETAIARPSVTVSNLDTRRSLAGDLDTIVLKTLKFSPGERYSTIGALADDLDRYLRGEPVMAQPDTAWYRIRKFSVRNKTAVAALSAVIAALAIGLSVSLWQMRKARLEAARAEAVKSFALAMLDSADSDSGASGATTAVDLLQAARQRVETELTGQPGVAAELMTAIAYALLGQDHAQEAAELLRKAIPISNRINGTNDARTLESQVIYGEALYALGKNEEAIALLRTLPALAHRLHDAHAEIDAWRHLSNAQIDAGDDQSGIASARAAVAAIPPHVSNTDRRSLLDALHAHLSLANALGHSELPGMAEQARSALGYATRLGPMIGRSATITARFFLGRGLVAENQPDEGLKVLKEAHADSQKFSGADDRDVSMEATLVGASCLTAGDIEGGRTAYQEAFDTTIPHASEVGAYRVGWAHYGLALAFAASNDPGRALPYFDEAIRLFTESSGSDHPIVLRSQSNRALALARLGRLAESDSAFAALADRRFAGDQLFKHEDRLAVLRSLQGRHEEAIALARAGADGLSASHVFSVQARGLATLGSVLLAAGRPGDAIGPLQQATSLFDKSQIAGSPERVETAALLDRARNGIKGQSASHTAVMDAQ